MQTTVGQVLINSALPEHLRDYNRILDKAGVKALLEQVASEGDSEVYKQVIAALHRVGHEAAQSNGSSFSINDLRTPPRTKLMQAQLKAKTNEIIERTDLTDQQKEDAVTNMTMKATPVLEQSMLDEMGQLNNPFADQVKSGSRGGKSDVRSMLLGDMMVTDHRSRLIPIPLLRGYAQGYDPAEYWAASYGARRGTLSTKLCLAAGTQVAVAPTVTADYPHELTGSCIKAIEQLTPGDRVYTMDWDLKIVVTPVVALRCIGDRECTDFGFASHCCPEHAANIVGTPEHKIQVAGSNDMKELAVVADGKLSVMNAFNTAVFFDKATPVGIRTVYDIEVAHDVHRFILANGLVVSNSTQRAGFFGKQLVQAAHKQVITEKDCGTTRGIPVKADDPDNVGAVLAEDMGDFKAGTPINTRIHKQLAEQFKDQPITVRSALTCESSHGLCSHCAGIRERGSFPEVGDNIGVAVAQSLAEQLSQGALSEKHCVAIGTYVRMADSSEKKIEDIKVGDMVLGADRQGVTQPVEVLRTFDNGIRPCWRNIFLHFDKSGHGACVSLNSTTDHKLLAAVERFTQGETLQELPVGLTAEQLYAGVVESTGLVAYWRYEPVYLGPTRTYDIEVDHPDHLFVLANGLIVSNSGGRAKGHELSGQPTGFKLVNQLVQVPKLFTGGAAVAKLDGVVREIKDAPQGGKHILIGDQEHFVPAGLNINVKPGSRVEQGDVLSEGLPNPAELVEHKGLGAGRLDFVNLFRDAYKSSGLQANRRNIEVMTRGLINHVHVTEPDGIDNAMPDDTLEYSSIERNYRPRYGFKVGRPTGAVGQYLERPSRQYTIGTRVTRKVSDDLTKSGVQNITTHADPPPFKPHMVRAMEQSSIAPDWQTRMGGSYLEKGLLDALHTGVPSEIHGTSYIPALARGKGFGEDLATTGKY